MPDESTAIMSMPELRREQRLRLLDRISATLGVLAFLMLVYRYGFPAFQMPRAVIISWYAFLPIGLFLEAIYRLLWVKNPWQYLTLHPWRYVILLMILLEISGVAAWSQREMLRRGSPSLIAGELYLALFLLGFAGSWIEGAILANRWLSNLRIPVLALPSITFALTILCGAGLLSLPGLHRSPTSFLDSLFTSTSAVCVTGLTVYDVSATLKPIGQAVLAVLIQLGGLGIMTVLGMLALWHGGAFTAGERVAFSKLIGGVYLAETRRLIATVLKVTLTIELCGTLAFWLLWKDRLDHAVLKGAFHAISAFCNSGFSLFHDSVASFRSDPPTLIILMMLIVAGGLGFPVAANIARAGLGHTIPWVEKRPLGQASRAVLYLSGGLIALGAVFFWLDGWIGGTSRSVLDAVFQSVTTRTAGFQVESQLNFTSIGFVTTIVLMIIGASPQSAGGGVKTTIFGRLFTRMDPRDPVPSSKWLISFKPFRIAFLLVALYVSTGILATVALHRTEAVPLREAGFEVLSALGTVGLSRGITPNLSVTGKCVVIILMFCGRVLYPTIVMRMIRKRREISDPVPWT